MQLGANTEVTNGLATTFVNVTHQTKPVVL